MEPIDAAIADANGYGALVERVFSKSSRILISGEAGSGKSTLAAVLARALELHGGICRCISADPGSPAFGPPGAASLGEWHRGAWDTVAIEALCTLDAARFRLPLAAAVQRLAARQFHGTLLTDMPGVVRGVAGAELLEALSRAVRADSVLVLTRGAEIPLHAEYRALGIDMHALPAAPEAHLPTKPARARLRTLQWDAHLQGAQALDLALSEYRIVGTPPPADVDEAWLGRQVAFLRDDASMAEMGEILAKRGDFLHVRSAHPSPGAATLLVRDAQRRPDGLLGTAVNPTRSLPRDKLPPDMVAPPELAEATVRRPVIRIGPATATLVNGIFGDPLLHLRLRHQKRSLLFDLGEAGRVPARIAHQITDVFVSHAHLDHIGGFLWLLRSRMGEATVCRLFGPPGFAANIMHFLGGIRWDRIGDRGPRFEVREYHDGLLQGFSIQAGISEMRSLGRRSIPDGVILKGALFRIRAATLDHGIPVLAYAFEPACQLNVRKERLAARELPPGSWLSELKSLIAGNQPDAELALPDGTRERAGSLADDLLLVTPAQRLVYATDLADTPDNRQRVVELARGAHTLVCEATFLQEHVQHARSTGHLTARACGEIAAAAGVTRLVPFHFSRRYEHEPARVYNEVRAAWPGAVTTA